MDSDDLEFLQAAASALDISDAEYSAWMEEFQSEEFYEAETPGELLSLAGVGEEEFYSLAGDWDDWLEADSWYELTAEYTEED